MELHFFQSHLNGDLWSSGNDVQLRIKGPWVRVLVVAPFDRHMSTSRAAQLVYQGQVVCGLPLIHAPKRDRWDHLKSVGKSPLSWASNSGRKRNP
jgi:hypothetical protein